MSQAFLAILLSSSSWKYSSDIAFLIRGTTFTSPPSGVNPSPSKADTSYVLIYQSEVVSVFTRVRHLYQALFSPSDSFFFNNTTASIIHSHHESPILFLPHATKSSLTCKHYVDYRHNVQSKNAELISQDEMGMAWKEDIKELYDVWVTKSGRRVSKAGQEGSLLTAP
ncbi:uncharacterized protein RSE6_00458 [Rhynchosporium secalis]|uniref:Uncharacterized protein n=1 Tax=Rhynchosporium secalis TaxID=38038 RepID=A0A1E1LVA9_RHYSE|nr:uncharacterized protein RSE6_00458 [Rhynchosporium secalis]